MRMTQEQLRAFVAAEARKQVAAERGRGRATSAPRARVVRRAAPVAVPMHRQNSRNPVFAPAISRSAGRRDPASMLGAYAAVHYQAKKLGYQGAAGAAEVAKSIYGESSPVHRMIVKDMTAGTANAGAEFVPTLVSDEVIAALEPMTIMRANGARVVDNPTGNLDIPRLTSGVRGTWVGEASSSGNRATEPPTDSVPLRWNKLMVTVAVSKDLLLYSGPNAEAAISQNVLRGAAVTEDAAFLRATAGTHNPTGVRHQCDAGNVFATNNTIGASVDPTGIEKDLGQLKLKLLGADIAVQPDTGLFVMSVREIEELERLRDANGNKIYPELTEGKIGRYRAVATNSIPINLGTGTNESEAYFLNMPDIIIGDGSVGSIEVLENVAYTDSAGVLQSGVDNDVVLIKMQLRTDIALQYAKAVAVCTGVRWGQTT